MGSDSSANSLRERSSYNVGKGMDGMNEQAISSSINSIQENSFGRGNDSAVNSLRERSSHNERSEMSRMDENDNHDSTTPSLDEEQDQMKEEDTCKPLGTLYPLDSHFLDRIDSQKASLKDIKTTCRVYGLNPNTPKNLPPHSVANIIQLAKMFMKIRTGETHIQEITDDEFEAMMQFGNLPPTLCTDKSRRGEAAEMFKRWLAQSVEVIGRIGSQI
jgi:hypothetical protein